MGNYNAKTILGQIKKISAFCVTGLNILGGEVTHFFVSPTHRDHDSVGMAVVIVCVVTLLFSNR